MGKDEFNCFLQEMITHDFFVNSCNFSEEERKQKEDWIALVQSMLLLDFYSNEKIELKDLSDESLITYLKWARECYDDCQKNTMKSAIQYLEQAFWEKRGDIDKGSIPLLVCLADKAMQEEMEPADFRIWWEML